jgi:Ig-like domain CHU_C associated/PKD-like domain/Secretion system C-terminal sorting domain
MKKIYFMLLTILFAATSINAQVTVTATAGTPGPTVYTTLKGAFDALNAGTHQGIITVSLTGNTTETASAVLNSGAVAPAVYTSVSITATVPVTISGSIVGAVIKLNGADNVTIDGRIGGIGRNITVQNTNTSSATAAIWLASVAAGNGCSGNVIRNLELLTGIDPTSSGNSTFGIIMCGTTISTTANGIDNDNNSFIANRIIRARYGIVTRGTTTDLNINPVVTDNIIGPSSFGPDQIVKTGILMQADIGALVSRNTIQFVGCLEPQTCLGTDRVGIGIGSESWSVTDATTITSSGYTVTKNIIHDIVEENTFSAIGIKLGTTQSGGATNNLVANNTIYNLRANSTAGDQLCGIGVSGGNGDQIVNNSISITGDVDPGASTASAIFGNAIRIPGANAANNANFVVRNNSIYLDVNSNTTTVHFYPITLNSAAYSFGTGALNNNNYYFNAANTQLRTGGLSSASGVAATTEFATLANWQAALTTPQDAASIQANPNYLSNTGDLHILGTSPNINVGSTIAAVTDDIDNEVRPNGAAYDIGSDEFYATPGALQLSSATYSGNEGTSVTITVNRTGGSSGTVGATYTLTNGTAIGGAACGVGVDFTNPGPQTVSLGDGISSATFTIPLCTDAVADPGETFTIALSLPTGGATIGAQATATTSIVDIPPPFNGTYTVGSGGNYPSLTNNGGIFEAINLAGASGNITINIISDLAGELGTHALNEIAGAFTVLIKPFGAPRTITGSNAVALIRLNGADGVTINGSTAGATAAACLIGGDASIRQLTIQNTNTGTSAVVIAALSGVNGAQNNTIKNVNVLGQDPTTTLVGIALGGNTPGTVGTDNDNNRVENCSVKRVIFGIYSAGLSLANQNTGTVIKQNDLSALTTDRVRRVGIVVFNENGVQITENSVAVETNESADAIGIGVGTQGIDATNTTSGGVTNAFVSKNKINGIAGLSTVGFSAAGITVAGDVGGANTIQNNMITGVTAPSTSPDLVAGIYVVGATGSNTRVYYNSISMTGDRGTVATQMPGYGIAITGTDPTVDLRNNILYTTQIASGGGVDAKSYAIGMVSTTFANLNSNYNDFWSTGANDGGFRTGSLSTAAGTDYAALAGWQAAVADDPNSVEANPGFVNPVNNLHLLATNDLGTNIPGIVDDYDCEARNATTPDIGADEFVPPCVTAVGGTASGSAIFCISGTPTITATGYSTASGSGYQWISSTVLADYPAAGTPVGGQTNPASLTTGVVSTTTYYWLRVTCSTNSSTDNSTLVTITVNPINTVTLSSAAGTNAQTVCINTPITNITYSTTGATGATFSGLPAGVTGNWAANVVTISGSPTTTVGSPFSYTVTLTGGCGVVTANGTITVTPNNTITLTSAPGTNAQTVCINTPISNITYSTTGATGATFSGLPAGVTGIWAANLVTISGSPTTTVGSPFNYTVTLTGGCGVVTATGTITVNPNNTITLTSAAGTNAQTVCINSAITNITYATTGATGATFSGLPAGVTGNWAANVVTISGSPTTTVGSPFGYTVTLTGGCGTVTANGTITVTPANTISLTSAAATTSQIVCVNTPITNITYATTGATGATFSGLPAGVTGNWAANVVTISGTPTTTVGSPFSYIVTLTGGCGTVTANGTITVQALPVVNAPTVTQPTIASPTGTIVVNATGGPTLEYSVNGAGGPFQLSNTFSGLAPGGSYNIAVRLVNSTGCVVLYSANPILMNSVNGRVTDVLVGASPFQDSMWTINLANYTLIRHLGPTLAGFTITGMNGIATNPLTGEHFMIAKVSAGGRRLVKVNVQTGVCTLIGSLSGNFSTLAFKPNGELYGVTGDGASPAETMFKIDTLNATSTFYRTLGNGADGEVIAFNPDDNFFYHWSGNGTVVWEKFATDVDPIVPLTTPVNGEVFGALYAGAGKMWVSNINSTIRLWDISTQTASAILMNTPDDLRGLVRESCASSLTAGGPTTICSGNSVLLTVNGGVSNYQWYLNGAIIGGANASTYSATAAGLYNCRYMDGCGVTDSVSLGITVAVNPTPDAVATPASQTICSGSPITTIVLTGTVGGTAFNWTRDNTVAATGIAASGAGNISGSLTNTTNAPVTVSFTITPSTGSCTGAPITATVTVNPIPDVDQPANQVVCNNFPTAAVNFTGAVAGTVFNWTNNTPSIGLAASGTGNIASFTALNPTTSPVVATVTVTPSVSSGGSSTSITMPAQSSTFGPNVRGYWFTAPANFVMTSIFVPTDASSGNQSIAVLRFNGNTPPPVFSTTTNAFSTLFLTQNDATVGNIPVNIPINAGEVIGILGSRAGTNSYGNGSSGITIAGNPVSTTRMGMQFPLATTTPQDIWQEPASTNISRVLFEYSLGGGITCTGTPKTFTITVNPTPAATISYTGSPYCSNAGTATVTRTGTAGGTYSAAPAGLTLNAVNGDVTLGTSTPGTYTVTYTVAAAGGCAIFTTTTSITITALPAATISYAGSPYCSNAGTATVTRTGTAGGTYSAAPAGLTINAANGDVTLGTSTPGTYTVTYTIAAGGGCPVVTATTSIAITALPAATISYTGSPYCSNAGTATVTRTGTVGGTYSAAPAGLTINAANGDVTLGTSTSGTYTVTYTIAAGGGCPVVTATTSITITALPAATISYTGSPYCSNAGIATVTQTGTAGGTYTAVPAGLTINAATGAVTLGTSTPGTYTVTYTIAAGGGCPVVTATASITITSAPSATISYAGTPYCSTDLTAPVTRTGTAGGTYSSTAGLTINAATGTVTPNTSTPGTYTVTYTVAAGGGCGAFSTTTSITITAAPNAIIQYFGSPYCSNGGTATVSRFGTAGGTYSAAPAGLTINAATGAVTLATSTPGTYTVTYTIAASGGCGVTITQATITVTAAPNATISYAGSPYCSNAGTANVTLTGTPANGTYTAAPAGLSINATTGAVNLAASAAGTYTVTYTVAASGGCATYTTTTTITITTLPAATIAYTGSPYCSNAGTANVTRAGTAGGTYTAAAGLSINAATGAVNLAASTAGTYTVTYTLAAGGGCPAVTATASITITALPVATITYAGSPYCQPGGTATITRTGTAGGTYSAAPAGLVINAANGDINIGTSTAGTYTVTYTLAAAGGCGIVTATTAVTINSLSVAATSATSTATALCGPGSVTLGITGGVLGSGASWRWYSGSCGGTLVGTGATLNFTVNATTTYFVRAEGPCNTTTCASVTVTVNAQPTISIAASPRTTLLPGQTTTLTATFTPAAGNTFIWYRNGIVVPGASGSTLVVGVDGVVGTYTARATTGSGCTALSNAVTIIAESSTLVFVYPNPSRGQFQVRVYNQQGKQISVLVHNARGQRVYFERKITSAPYTRMDVDLRSAAAGQYTVSVVDSDDQVIGTRSIIIYH